MKKVWRQQVSESSTAGEGVKGKVVQPMLPSPGKTIDCLVGSGAPKTWF